MEEQKKFKRSTIAAIVLILLLVLLIVIVIMAYNYDHKDSTVYDEGFAINDKELASTTGEFEIVKPKKVISDYDSDYYNKVKSDEGVSVNSVYNIENLSAQLEGRVNGISKNSRGTIIVCYTDQNNQVFTVKYEPDGEVSTYEGLYLNENETITVSVEKNQSFDLPADDLIIWEIIDKSNNKHIEIVNNRVKVNDKVEEATTVTVIGRKLDNKIYCTIKFVNEIFDSEVQYIVDNDRIINNDLTNDNSKINDSELNNNNNNSHSSNNTEVDFPQAQLPDGFELEMVKNSINVRFVKKDNGLYKAIIYAIAGSDGHIDNYESHIKVTDAFKYEDELGQDNNSYEEYFNNTDEIVINPGIKTLGYFIFARFINTKAITIPTTIERISPVLFDEANLMQINYNAINAVVDNTYLSFDERDFETGPFEAELITNERCTVNIGNSVEVIPDLLFASSSITELNIGYSVKTIGSRAFMYAYGLDILIIPCNVEKILDYSFYFIEAIDIYFSEGLKYIGEHAFSYAYRTYVYQDYGEDIYYDDLEAYDDIEEEVFSNEPMYERIVIIPETVETVEEYAFEGNDSIKEISFPANLNSFNPNIIEECFEIEKINFNFPMKKIIPNEDRNQIVNWGLYNTTIINFTDQSFQIN